MKKSITLLSQSFLMLALILIFDHSAYAQRIPGTWEEKAAMGSGRFWAFSFALDGKVYGGTGRPQFSATNPLNDFWEYDPATDVWTQKADYPAGNREGATGFTANGRGFAAFGTAFIQFTKDVYEYLPASNTWAQKASVPGIGFAYSHGFAIDSMYYIGPENGTNQVYAYNVNSDTWSTVAPYPGDDRRAQVSFALKGKGYIGMGMFVFGGVRGDFWSYDPVADAWTEVASLSPVSDQSSAFAIGDYGYVHNVGSNAKNTYRYDPVNDVWELETAMPGDRIANATTSANDSIGFLLFGQRTISGGNFANDAAYIFTPGRDTSSNTSIRRPQVAFPDVRLLTASDGSLTVEMAATFAPASAKLTLADMSGKAVIRQSGIFPGRIHLPVHALPTGIYLLNIELPGLPLHTLKWLKP